MDELSNSQLKVLPEFQEFLLERRLVPEEQVPFLGYWASKSLDFARKRTHFVLNLHP